MFDSILSTSQGTLSMQLEGVCLGSAFLMGIVIAIVFAMTSKAKTSRGFIISLVVLPALVQSIIVMVNGNLGTGVAILGAFSLVRFRSIPGNSKDISTIFFTMVVGLACGMGYITYAAFITIITCVIMLLVNYAPFKTRGERSMALKITIYEDLDYTTIFDEIFSEYLKSYEKVFVKTTNMGSMYQLNYLIEMKDPKKEKEFIDALRCKNGNLNIQCGSAESPAEQL